MIASFEIQQGYRREDGKATGNGFVHPSCLGASRQQ